MEHNDRSLPTSRFHSSYKALRAVFVAGACGLVIVSGCNNGSSQAAKAGDTSAKSASSKKDTTAPPAASAGPLDTALYNKLLVHLANGDSSGRWPVRTAYPKPGAILPFNRIVAYYGNLYSKRMGVLGEYPPKEMLEMLQGECRKWQAADPTIPVLPCLHYIAVTAQGAPGKDGKYRARMPFKQIDSVLHMAARINAIVFLDIQVGFSNVQSEVPQLEKYLSMPNVHLGIDPEFAMSKSGKRPGLAIGSLDAADANWCIEYLSKLAKANSLPPKILMFHRFTKDMLTNPRQIHPTPDCQFILDMDGWGPVSLKTDSYKSYVAGFPVQFTGFKLFYKNDVGKPPRGVHLPSTKLMTPAQVLAQKPAPIYIQYQ
ncbi:MAG TPA: hypothetical protein VMH27_04590 [Puia sp.]|nr:hypothetical protein [Puia sp.]